MAPDILNWYMVLKKVMAEFMETLNKSDSKVKRSLARTFFSIPGTSSA